MRDKHLFLRIWDLLARVGAALSNCGSLALMALWPRPPIDSPPLGYRTIVYTLLRFHFGYYGLCLNVVVSLKRKTKLFECDAKNVSHVGPCITRWLTLNANGRQGAVERRVRVTVRVETTAEKQQRLWSGPRDSRVDSETSVRTIRWSVHCLYHPSISLPQKPSGV